MICLRKHIKGTLFTSSYKTNFLLLQQYLIPHVLEQSGLTDDMTVIKEDALDALIKNYCRESGVRNLLKHIEKVNWTFF